MPWLELFWKRTCPLSFYPILKLLLLLFPKVLQKVVSIQLYKLQQSFSSSQHHIGHVTLKKQTSNTYKLFHSKSNWVSNNSYCMMKAKLLSKVTMQYIWLSVKPVHLVNLPGTGTLNTTVSSVKCKKSDIGSNLLNNYNNVHNMILVGVQGEMS